MARIFAETAGGGYSIEALEGFSQRDGAGGGRDRCAATCAVAALVVRGRSALLAGVAGARRAVEGGWAHGDARARRLEALAAVEGAARAGALDTGGLARLAGVLHEVFSGDDPTAAAVSYEEVDRMLEAVGLAPEERRILEDPDAVEVGFVATREPWGDRETIIEHRFSPEALRAAAARVVERVLGAIPEGGLALASVFRATDPNDRGTNKPNHVVLVSRAPLRCYDPEGAPNLFEGDAARAHLAAHIGILAGTPARRVEPNGDAIRRYPLRAAATLIRIGGVDHSISQSTIQ